MKKIVITMKEDSDNIDHMMSCIREEVKGSCRHQEGKTCAKGVESEYFEDQLDDQYHAIPIEVLKQYLESLDNRYRENVRRIEEYHREDHLDIYDYQKLGLIRGRNVEICSMMNKIRSILEDK